MGKTHRQKTMSANEKPAWVGLFPDHDFEFRFGARPGNAVAFFADTSENATLMEGRRSALEETPAQCLFEEPSAAQAVVECSDWAGLDGGACRELALHWEPDFLILLPDENGRFVFRARGVFSLVLAAGRKKRVARSCHPFSGAHAQQKPRRAH
jgi:hypothetical protein